MLDEADALQAEQRERRVASAQTGHDEVPGRRSGEDAPVWRRQACEKADGERAARVDGERGPRKAALGEHGAYHPSREAAENAARSDGGIERKRRSPAIEHQRLPTAKPAPAASRPSESESTTFSAARRASPSRVSASVCRLKDETVVKLPRNPVPKNSQGPCAGAPAAKAPIRKQPATLTASVPQGNVSPIVRPTQPDTRNRAGPPMAAPSATSSMSVKPGISDPIRTKPSARTPQMSVIDAALACLCEPRQYLGRGAVCAMRGVETVTVAEDDGVSRIDRWFRRRYPQLTQGQIEKM